MASGDKKSYKVLRKENKCDEKTPMAVKNYLQKQFIDMFSNGLEERIISLICGPRDERETEIAENILSHFSEITGEKCTLQTPKNGFQSIMVFIADQVAVWLTDAVDESDAIMLEKRENELKGFKGGEGDGAGGDDVDDEDDENIETITKMKRRSKPSTSSKANAGGDGMAKKTDGKTRTGGNQQGQAKRVSKSSQNKDRDEKTEEHGGKTKQSKAHTSDAGAKKSSGAPASAKQTPQQSKPATRDGSKTGGKKSDFSKAEVREEPTTESKPHKQASKPSASNKSVEKSRSSVSKRLSERQSEKKIEGSRQDQQKSREKSAEKPFSPRTSQQLSQPPKPRSRTSSEMKREKVANILNTQVSQMIMESGEMKPTPRQEALQDVISKKLESTISSRDSATINAIKAASALIATYIDQTASKAELEYGDRNLPRKVPVSQKGKGPLYHVRNQQGEFAIKQLTHREAADKVYKARGLPAPGAIILTEGTFNKKETKDWARWATEVADLAEGWSKWIDVTVNDAVNAANKNKSGDSPKAIKWRDWKDTTQAEALEWRRNKKLLDSQAAMFQNKANISVKS